MSPEGQPVLGSGNPILQGDQIIDRMAFCPEPEQPMASHENLRQNQSRDNAINEVNTIPVHGPLHVYNSMGMSQFQQPQLMRHVPQLFAPGPSLQTTNAVNPGFLGLDVPGLTYQNVTYEPDLDLHINWLPTNDTVDLDYRSILDLTMSGQGLEPENILPVGSVDGRTFSGPANIPDISAVPAGRHFLTQAQPVTSPSGTSSSISWTCTDSRAGNVEGELYATSKNGARIPCTVRSKVPHVLIPGTHPQSAILNDLYLDQASSSSFGFPNLSHLATDHSSTTDQRDTLIWKSTYDEILHHFERLCLDCEGFYCSFTAPNFPSILHFDLFIRLFLASFNPVVPILHQTLATPNDFWLLTLAMAAVGSQYTQTQEFDAMVLPLHEYLRRALQIELERCHDSSHQVAMFQSILLSHIGMLHYGPTQLKSHALPRCGGLVSLARSYGILESTSSEESDFHIKDMIRNASSSVWDEQWRSWVRLETKRRLGYLAWLIDCMSQYHHFDLQPQPIFDVPNSSLPHDGLWNTTSVQEWAELFQRTDRNPSLQTAVRTLFLERRVKSDLGEPSRIVLLYGVYHEIDQVKSYFQRSLASWIPSAQQVLRPNLTSGQHVQEMEASGDKWLNELPTFSAWRNAALDCVDVLHWAANGTIALLSGAEHPTVFHLHFSRVILLVPYRDILTLVLFTAGSTAEVSKTPTREDAAAAEQEILRWAQRDESKARLAAVHCGCLYWHVRRYSTLAFYEPSSVFLATLTLWAYSYYASRASPIVRPDRSDDEHVRSGSPSRQSSPLANAPASRPEAGIGERSNLDLEESPHMPGSDPTFIRLDRPNDDEMVQHFVRCGRPSNMRAYITGVGDICVAKGPTRILREGRKILEGVSLAWGRTKESVAILRGLERAMSGVEVREEPRQQ
ncbi:hypothetical protein AK830_g1695 [Neonectria ditissima]|uniref:Transcription factor domain-containing protein n=1 Tax=Neonectria ditissima TaxID=78410 RepID=A0A0P7BTX5_9HYPO|nr:hypothetical protein AK830_g1695 [Neonectria ditissima]